MVAFYVSFLPAFQFLCLLMLICSSPPSRKAPSLLGPLSDGGPALQQPATSPWSYWFTGGGCRLTHLGVVMAAWSCVLPSLHVFLKRVAELLAVALFWSAQKRYPSFWLSFQHSFPYVVLPILSGSCISDLG